MGLSSCGINLLRYAIIPKKSWKFCLDFGKGMSMITLTFSGSGKILFPDILWPKNISSVAPKAHLFLFSLKPDFRILFKTCSVRMSNWFRVDPHIMNSSRLFLAPSQPFIISLMSCWKTSLCNIYPIRQTLKSKSAKRFRKASNFVKNLALFISERSSSAIWSLQC